MNLGIISFDSGTALDRVRLVGNNPTAIGNTTFLPELAIALSENQTSLRRAYALGYVRGCLVGFGVEDAMTVREAETVFFAEPLSFDNLVRAHAQLVEDHEWARQWDDTRAQAVAQASGVLYGYKEATLELVEAFTCDVCDRRVVRDLDEYVQCLCGFFCANPDCARNYPHHRDCEL